MLGIRRPFNMGGSSENRGMKHFNRWSLIFLFLQLHGQPSIARIDNVARFPSDDGCAVTGSWEYSGKKLTCWHTPFTKYIVQHFAELGSQLSEVDVQSCIPMTPLTLSESMFASNTMLRQMRINNCGITTIAPGTFNGTKLLVLDLSRNSISSVTNETFAGLDWLMALYLEHNAITSIARETFKGHNHLAGLELGYNKIQTLENGSFLGLDKLEQLTLESNPIGTLWTGTFEGLGNLQELFLAGNMYLELQDDSFTGLTGVHHIDLSQNQDLLSRSSAGFFSGLVNLTWVEFTGVNLGQAKSSNLSAYFKDQRDSLTKLTLTNTQFNNDLMPMIHGLSNLQVLDLDGNNIGFILASSLPELATDGSISLKENEIMYVEEGSFRGVRGLSVSLDGNPFYCSCSLVWFAVFLRSENRSIVANKETLRCGGPINLYRTRVMDYAPYPDWALWVCSPYLPYISIAFVVGFGLLVVFIVTIVWCNLVNIRHCLLERRESSRRNEQEERCEEERRPLVHAVSGYSSLPKGKTCAFICYDMHDPVVLSWVNQHIEDKLYNHPLRITLQWSAGNNFIPIWKQVKDYGFGVQSFLVIATDDFLTKYWPEISEKSGYENIAKFVLVLMGKKQKDLPKNLKRLRCPTFEWPETRGCCTTLGRRRLHFWKQVRIVLKGIPD